VNQSGMKRSLFGAILLLSFTLHAAEDEIPQLAPPLPEIPPSFWEQFSWTLWIAVPLLLAAIGSIVFLVLRPGKPPMLLAPAAQARALLAPLHSQPEDGTVLSRVSKILQHYLINAFWLNPTEATTTEFCNRLNTCEKIGPELATAIGDFLRRCDERKFAPDSGESPLGASSRALELVDLSEAKRIATLAAAQLQSQKPA
jgi:hypothetical protein